jgi:pilus assembly protein Flp/PilA
VKRLLKFLKDEEGVTALEYSLIAALIFLVIVGAVIAYSSRMQNMYNSVADSMP